VCDKANDFLFVFSSAALLSFVIGPSVRHRIYAERLFANRWADNDNKATRGMKRYVRKEKSKGKNEKETNLRRKKRFVFSFFISFRFHFYFLGLYSLVVNGISSAA